MQIGETSTELLALSGFYYFTIQYTVVIEWISNFVVHGMSLNSIIFYWVSMHVNASNVFANMCCILVSVSH